MRLTRLHFVLGLAVTTGGALGACGSSNDDTCSSCFNDPDGSIGTLDGSPSGDDGGDATGIKPLDSGITIPPGDIKTIQFTPGSWSVTSDGVTPQSKNFLLSVTRISTGDTVNVNADSLSFNRPDLAKLTGGEPAVLTVQGSIAGTGTLQGVYQGKTATATVTVAVSVSQTNGTLPAGAQGALDGVTGGSGSGGSAGGDGGLDGGPGAGGDSGSTHTSDDGGNDGGFGTPIYTPDDPGLGAILYPYNQTVFPLGIDSPLLMWTTPAAATDVYKVHITETGFTYDYYTAASSSISKDTGHGANDVQLQIPQTVWDQVTASNLGDPMVVTIARYDTTKSAAYVSVVETWPVAHDSLRGSIYYWAISGANDQTGTGAAHLARIHPGTGATAEYIAGGQCIGCHAVSSDGTTLIGSSEGTDALGNKVNTMKSDPAPSSQSFIIDDGRGWATYKNTSSDPTALPTEQFQSDKFGGNLAVSNDGKYVVYGDQELHLATTADGALVANSNLEALSYTTNMNNGWMDPAFSPDGTKLAVVQGTVNGSPFPYAPCTSATDYSCPFYLNDYYENLTGGGLQIVDFSGAAFKNQRQTVAQSGSLPGAVGVTNTFMSYPSFAPDSATLAFQASDAPDGCHYSDGNFPDGGTNADCGPMTVEKGAVYLTKDGTTTAVRLTNLSDPPAAGDRNLTFEPTFNPNARGGYFWVVVSSSRGWGNKKFAQGANGGDTNINKRLWVAAVDESGATDPSHPPFFLQSQETSYENKNVSASINMRAFWSLSSCTASAPAGTAGTDAGSVAACGSGFECCSGFCEQGTCVDSGSVSCASVDQACTSTAQCCGNSGGAVTCSGGAVPSCQPVQIR